MSTNIGKIQILVDSVFSAKLPNRHFASFLYWDNPVRLFLEDDTIVSRWNGFCMDVKDGSTANGTLIQQWQCIDTDVQRFDKIPVAGGFFMIRNRHSGKCLAISDGGTENGALLAQYDCNDADFNHH
jgi:hypothetical protein